MPGVCVTTLLLAFCSYINPNIAGAALLAYEGFDYGPSGSDLLGQNGGIGFNGAWANFGQDLATGYDMASGSLPGPGFRTSGHNVRSGSLSRAGGLLRSLTAPMGAPGTTRYISFLLQPQGTLHQGFNNGWFGLGLNASTGTRLFIGKPGGGNLNAYVVENFGGSGQVASVTAPAVGQAVLLVIKAEFTAGLDRFTLYVNPTPGAAEPATGTVKNNSDVGTVYSVIITSTGAFALDEIRIGTTYADVTPSSEGPPLIVSQPQDHVVLSGANVTFNVGALGTLPLSYQWFLNESNPINGATSSTLVLNNVTEADNGNYHVVVTNALGSITSRVARLTVVDLGNAVEAPNLVWTIGGSAPWNPLSSITHDGVDAAQSGTIGDAQESWLQTTVHGPGTLSFWWKVSSEQDFDWLRFHLDGLLKAQISGEVDWQQRVFFIPEGSHTLKWRYVKDFAATAGQDHGWVDQVSLTPASGAPEIVMQPASQTVWEGANVTLETVTLGSPPLSHQWFFNDSDPVPGGTGPNLTLENFLPDQAGSYQVVISNAFGAVTSAPALVTLTNNGPVSDILLFVDSPLLSPFETALDDLGLSYQRFSNAAAFASAVASANRDSTLVIVDAPQHIYDLSSVVSFIQEGGRVLLEANTLAGSPALAAALDVTLDIRSKTPLPVYAWNGTPLFIGLSTFLDRMEIGLDEDNHKLHVAPGGYGAAGFTANPSAGEAAIVIGNFGRTILNGFWLAGITSSEDAVRLAENEILFLTGPVSATAPMIRAHPRDQQVLADGTATFSVIAWGQVPLSYQWHKDGAPIPGATGPTYQIAGVQAADEGGYSVVVTNASGSVTSTVASLTITSVGTIETVLLFRDDSSLQQFSAYETALMAMGINYQKFTTAQSFAEAVNGANPLTTLLIVDSIAFQYDFTTTVNFVVAGGRAIVQYWSLTSDNNLAAACEVSAVQSFSSPPPVYAWGDSPIFNGITSPLGLTDRLTVDGQRLQPIGGGEAKAGYVSAPSANQAAVVVGNQGRTIVNGFALEEITSSAQANQLAQNEIEFLFPHAPAISGQPRDQTVFAGRNVSFSVSADGDAPLSYRWYKGSAPLANGTRVSGSGTSSLTLANTEVSDSGAYSVVISNTFGVVTSQVAQLVVQLPPELVLSYSGTNLDISWAPNLPDFVLLQTTNLSPPHWTLAPEGGVNPLLLSMTEPRKYFRLIHAPSLVVVSPPESQTVDQNSEVTFRVIASGAEPLRFQWRLAGNPIPQATNSILVIPNVQPSDQGEYTVEVTDGVGQTLMSEPAALIVSTIPMPPTIVLSPQDQTVTAGSTVTFTITITNTASLPIRYRWRHDSRGRFVRDVTLFEYTDTLIIPNASAAEHGGRYRVILNNSFVVEPSFQQSPPFTLTIE